MTEIPDFDSREPFIKRFAMVKQVIIDSLSTYYNGEETYSKRLNELLDSTVPGGKLTRGITVVQTLVSMLPADYDLDNDDLDKVCILGWCVELLQAFFLVADDIMDGSTMRRGAPCWYKVQGVGFDAINDAFLLESFVYLLLKKHFFDQDYYVQLFELFRHTSLRTGIGQMLDLSTVDRSRLDLTGPVFKMDHYLRMVKHKTSYYTFYLPLALGALLAGHDLSQDDGLVSICEQLGVYFQIQDDFLDCFGKEKITGKRGTDIQDGKCSWLIVRALEICDDKRLEILKENYGQSDPECVKRVKEVYTHLRIPELFHNFEETKHEELVGSIVMVRPHRLKQMIMGLLRKTFRRRK